MQQFYFSAQKVYSEKGSKALQMKEVLKILTSVTDDHSELHFVPQSDLWAEDVASDWKRDVISDHTASYGKVHHRVTA